eukprot:TRINITY_DN1971_c0_g2_i1.p1 TRINITY_DN1971_c0_g2~~TRINITY_DN1971_c0_g2_i1.p1  ORF type:complete len:992 (+),score=172.24 TRINITY_DN1971_c0_g2_i1:130-3105(+)
MYHLQEDRFRRQVDKALASVKTILENERQPQLAADVPHTYSDKYALAEYLTNSALAAQLNVLEALGVTEKILHKLVQWSEKRSVTLRFKAEEKCEFDREETRKVESATEHVTEVSSFFGTSKRTEKVITKITEYFWRFSVEYEIVAFEGSDSSDAVKLQGRLGKCETITTTNVTPHPQVRVLPHIDVNITWLLQHINSSDGVFNFRIDRSDAAKCRTPRRNPEVDSSLRQFSLIKNWALSVDSYLWTVFGKQDKHNYDLSSIKAPSIFVPVQPLFENLSGKAISAKEAPASAALVAFPEVSASPTGAVVLPRVDVNSFLWEQKRSLSECMSNFSKLFPAPKEAKLISTSEAAIVALMQHTVVLSDHFTDCIDYIEDMLYKQFVSAIGKIVTPVDFTNFMRFHNRKLFKTAFEPRPFCHAIRRPDHYPEGTVSIECQLADGSIPEPIFTTTRHIRKDSALAGPMRFPINAATNVVFGGDRYLHAWVNHQFAGSSGQSWSLVARARQFSSFILLVGRIASAEVFDPKAAIIIQNKDDLRIPLLMETLPTAKEFRDAIESMSPEQQRFCRAYRSMQLESTLFGLVVIQIKPQLEKLLNLHNDSLTKEIQLTQDLMELFIKYQVPSDLLSFDLLRSPNASSAERINGVKGNVRSMNDMLTHAKEKELKEAEMKAAQRALEEAATRNQHAQEVAGRNRRIQEEVERVKEIMAQNIEKVLQRGDRLDEVGGGAYNGPALGGASPRATGSVRGRGGGRSVAAPAKAAAPVSSPRGGRGGSAKVASRPTTGQSSIITPSNATSTITATTDSSPATTTEVAGSQTSSDTAQQGSVESGHQPTSSSQHTFDMTQIPAALDRKLEQLDTDSAVRPTIVNVGVAWTMRRQKAILADLETATLNENDQKGERNQAFDLLDFLSRSGALAIDCAELHVVIAATHCFEKSVVDTVIQDNINPIEKVERSTLIVASTIHDVDVASMIKNDQLERVRTYSPSIFPEIQ